MKLENFQSVVTISVVYVVLNPLRIRALSGCVGRLLVLRLADTTFHTEEFTLQDSTINKLFFVI